MHTFSTLNLNRLTVLSHKLPVCAVVCAQTGKWTGQMCASNYRFHYNIGPEDLSPTKIAKGWGCLQSEREVHDIFKHRRDEYNKP